MGSNSTRIIAVALLLLSVFVLPWWLAVIFAASLFFYYAPFYEGLAIGLIADLLYSVPREIFWDLPIFFICFLICFLLCKIVHKQLRMGN